MCFLKPISGLIFCLVMLALAAEGSADVRSNRVQSNRSTTVTANTPQLKSKKLRSQLGLALSLVRKGQADKAVAYLQYLLQKPSLEAFDAVYLDWIAKIQRQHPFSVSGAFSLLPSTNISRASSSTHFDTNLGRFKIDDGGQEQGGVGVRLGFQAHYNIPLRQGKSLRFTTSADRIWYRDAEQRRWRGGLSLDLISLSRRHIGRIGVHVDRDYYEAAGTNGPDLLSYGLHGSWLRKHQDGSSVQYSGRLDYRNYLERDNLSGPIASFKVYRTVPLSPRIDGSFGVTVERARPKSAHQRYVGGTLQAGVFFPLSDNTRLGSNLSVSLRRYDTNFPALNFARRDMVYRVGFVLTDQRIKVLGKTPTLSCGYKRQDSNVALYNMNATDCQIKWSYSF